MKLVSAPLAARPSQDPLARGIATRELTAAARTASRCRSVVHALATRSPLSGVVVLEYGLRYAAAALRAGGRRTLFFAAGALVSFCAVVGRPHAPTPIDRDAQEVPARASSAPLASSGVTESAPAS